MSICFKKPVAKLENAIIENPTSVSEKIAALCSEVGDESAHMVFLCILGIGFQELTPAPNDENRIPSIRDAASSLFFIFLCSQFLEPIVQAFSCSGLLGTPLGPWPSGPVAAPALPVALWFLCFRFQQPFPHPKMKTASQGSGTRLLHSFLIFLCSQFLERARPPLRGRLWFLCFRFQQPFPHPKMKTAS
jgi:hypothetical protein